MRKLRRDVFCDCRYAGSEKVGVGNFFKEFPPPKKYRCKDLEMRFLSCGFDLYSLTLSNPELPTLKWTGKKWQEVKP